MDRRRDLQSGPYIAALLDAIEYNLSTETSSFFLECFEEKDLDQQVHMLRGAK